MCGRFNLRSSASAIAQQFLPGVDCSFLSDVVPRYNIAPTQSIFCVLRPEVGASRQMSLFRWGLVPSWADSASIGNNMINARSETAIEKPAFRAAMKSRRCVIPADGYYEWLATKNGKQPYEFSRRDGRLLAFAGLWEQNKRVAPSDHPLLTCTILTTSANAFASRIHDRMPVILADEDIDTWIDPGLKNAEAVRHLMCPADEDILQVRPVSKRLNYVQNQGPDLLEPEEPLDPK